MNSSNSPTTQHTGSIDLDEIERLLAETDDMIQRLVFKANLGDMGRKPDPSVIERRAAALLNGFQKTAPHLIALARSAERMREALHEIDIEAANTIPRDGKDAAFAALERITRIINPFRARQALEGLKP